MRIKKQDKFGERIAEIDQFAMVQTKDAQKGEIWILSRRLALKISGLCQGTPEMEIFYAHTPPLVRMPIEAHIPLTTLRYGKLIKGNLIKEPSLEQIINQEAKRLQEL